VLDDNLELFDDSSGSDSKKAYESVQNFVLDLQKALDETKGFDEKTIFDETE
jgi:hypothetical protein